MRHIALAVRRGVIMSLVLLAGCTPLRAPTPSVSAPERTPERSTEASPEAPPTQGRIDTPIEDPMAAHHGDRALPRTLGKIERIDCRSGNDDLQARIAFEARGNQVMNFAYYSRWNFQTCSIHLNQESWNARWRLTEDGATRVQTPHGSFLIRSDADSFSFEFHDVERMKFCGMYGRIRGELVVKRGTNPPQCEARGILDL
jgi:hypothetical protein